jgi:hypothetical protein
VITTLFEDACDEVLLADMGLTNVLDRHPRVGGQRRRALSHPVA